MNTIVAYAFTGDVKKLKPAGWTFQKLYAYNYKAYRNDDIIMYVTTKMMLEVSNVDHQHQPALIEFIIANKDQPDTFWVQSRPVGKYTMTEPVYVLTNHGRIVTSKESHDLWLAANRELWDMGKVDGGFDSCPKEVVDAALQQKFAREGGRDPFRLSLEFVKIVLALHELHPLELLTIT